MEEFGMDAEHCMHGEYRKFTYKYYLENIMDKKQILTL
jgi:hypothetical protein